MLTILHPEILPHIAQLPAGLSPLTVDGVEGIVLVIKGSKETILAAKMNRGFRFYLAPVEVEGIRTWSLITAFFDDDSSPHRCVSSVTANRHAFIGREIELAQPRRTARLPKAGLVVCRGRRRIGKSTLGSPRAASSANTWKIWWPLGSYNATTSTA